MPTYEYRCTGCGNEFELFQKMSDEPKAACPKCGESGERKLSGGAGFLFKGSGFYITDSRGDSYKQAAKAESGTGGDAKPAGGDAKPAGGDAKPASSTSTPSGGSTAASE